MARRGEPNAAAVPARAESSLTLHHEAHVIFGYAACRRLRMSSSVG
jgi:hypothetical protein